MPALLLARLEGDEEPRLYSDKLKAFETAIFDQYRIKDLSPYSKTHHRANFWWIRVSKRHPHSCLAWHDDEGYERAVFLPGELRWQDTLALAREIFPSMIPSSITFRLTNYDGPYLYD